MATDQHPCPHPPTRRYAWHVYNEETGKLDFLCVCCCVCGAVLKGAATSAGDDVVATRES